VLQHDDASTLLRVILIACDARAGIPRLRLMATREVAAALLFLLGPAPARAQEPSLRWSYARGPGAEGCPDAPALRRAITAQLGRDPFADDGRDAMALDVRRAKKQLRARIELREEDGAVRGARELRGDDCAELAPAMTLAIAMAIDALAGSRPRPPPPPPPDAPVAVRQALDAEVPSVAPPPPPRLTAWNLSLGLLGAIDATTLVAVGLTLEADFVRPGYSVGVELRGNLPSSSRQGNAIDASLWTGSVVPCLRHKFAALCALISLGDELVTVYRGTPLLPPLTMSGFWLGLGVRMAIELPVHRRLALRLHADVIAPLLRHQLPAAGDEAAGGLFYITPPVSSSFGLALLAIFP
jgi:hypothetical protein